MNKFVIFSLFLVIIAAYIAVSGLFSKGNTPPTAKLSPTPETEPVACTLDAKVCPDGSAVGRIPPSCEFAPCPEGDNVSTGSAELFTSENTGISFRYLPTQDIGPILVEEAENKVYVYSPSQGRANGQSVEVFTKSPADTLQQAIQKQFLADTDPNQCVVLNYRLDPTYPQTFIGAEISYPIEGPDPGERLIQAETCGANYAKVNGIRYFLYDPAKPDRYLFFNIGQYAILAAPGIPWQTTLRFL